VTTEPKPSDARTIGCMANRFTRVLLVLGCLALASSVSAAPYGDARFYLYSNQWAEGDPVILRLRHDDHNAVKVFSETWDIVDADGAVVAQFYWTDDERYMAPHQYKTWEWDQRQQCYGACQNVRQGDPVPPGRYRVVTTVDGKEVSKGFSIGSYFHLGFDGRPKTDFTVFSTQPEVVHQMRAELEKPQEERQIVAGIVRQRKTLYNSAWSFVLDPPSIFLGEVFIEVCDGAPRYVERHLKEWRGEQWCPWSSYVESEGL